jgi:hypothetical protein
MTFGLPCEHKQGWKIATFAILRAMPRTVSIVRAIAVLLFSAATSAAVTPAGRWDCGATLEIAPSPLALALPVFIDFESLYVAPPLKVTPFSVEGIA